ADEVARAPVGEARDIARGVDSVGGAQPVVDDDRAVAGLFEAFDELGRRAHADADDGHIGGQDGAVVENDFAEMTAAPELDHGAGQAEPDSVLLVDPANHIPDPIAEDTRERNLFGCDDRDVLDAERLQAPGDLHPDEASADDNGVSCRASGLEHGTRIGVGAERKDAVQVFAGRTKLSRDAARADDEPVEILLRAVVEFEEAARCIQPNDRAAVHALDLMGLVEVVAPEEHPLLWCLTLQIILAAVRSVVGGFGLAGDHEDATAEVLLAEG